jgi:hypothetical protein
VAGKTLPCQEREDEEAAPHRAGQSPGQTTHASVATFANPSPQRLERAGRLTIRAAGPALTLQLGPRPWPRTVLHAAVGAILGFLPGGLASILHGVPMPLIGPVGASIVAFLVVFFARRKLVLEARGKVLSSQDSFQWPGGLPAVVELNKVDAFFFVPSASEMGRAELIGPDGRVAWACEGVSQEEARAMFRAIHRHCVAQGIEPRPEDIGAALTTRTR